MLDKVLCDLVGFWKTEGCGRLVMVLVFISHNKKDNWLPHGPPLIYLQDVADATNTHFVRT